MYKYLHIHLQIQTALKCNKGTFVCHWYRKVEHSRDATPTLKSRQLFTRIPHTWCTQQIQMRMRCSCWDAWTFANPTVNQSNVQDRSSWTNVFAWSERVKHRSVYSSESYHVGCQKVCVTKFKLLLNSKKADMTGTKSVAVKERLFTLECPSLQPRIYPLSPKFRLCEMNVEIKRKQTQTDGSMRGYKPVPSISLWIMIYLNCHSKTQYLVG